MTDSIDETIQSKNENSDMENIQENDLDTGMSSFRDEEKSSRIHKNFNQSSV